MPAQNVSPLPVRMATRRSSSWSSCDPGVVEAAHHLGVDGVLLLGAVERDDEHGTFGLDEHERFGHDVLPLTVRDGDGAGAAAGRSALWSTTRMTPTTEPVLLAGTFDPTRPSTSPIPTRDLARLRAQGPCVVDPERDLWYLLGSDVVQAGLSRIVRGHHRGPDRMVQLPRQPLRRRRAGPRGPRRIIAPTFSNREVQQFRDRAQEIVDGVLADHRSGGDLGVVETLGFVLPYTLTCDLLGIPDVENREDLRDWTWHSLQLHRRLPHRGRSIQELLASAALLAGHLA